MDMKKIFNLPRTNRYTIKKNCERICIDCPLYYGELIDDDLLCEQLSEEQLKWIIDNSIWLERWLKL